MQIKCYNSKCKHERNYLGKFTDDDSIITCTKCRHKLRLGKAKLKSEVALPHSLLPEVPHQYKKEIKKSQTGFIEDTKKDLEKFIGKVNMFDGQIPKREDLPELP
ncbi:MAG TPA: hypothetical protein ENH99_02415 [Candidatus Pacearchaeota archaeon]|nr:hypothetical protein [Candidatus Pacearchaeota archaeon]